MGADFPRAWDVARTYEVAHGFLRPLGPPERRYQPARYAQIATDLAKVQEGDERELLRFANRWGALGYMLLIASSGRRVEAAGGDPLWWAWAHARGVRVCLELLGYLQHSKGASSSGLDDYLEALVGRPWASSEDGEPFAAPEIRLDAVLDDDPTEPPISGPGLTYGVRWGSRTSQWAGYWKEEGESDDEALARQIVADIISANLVGLRPQFDSGGLAGPFAMYFDFHALIEVVYWHLAEFAQQSLRLGRCEECGAYFQRTHERQRFCPPEDWATEYGTKKGRRPESACAKRAMSRSLRLQRREGGI